MKYKIKKNLPGTIQKEKQLHAAGFDFDEYDSLAMSVVSSTECTGLTVMNPEDEYEAGSYKDIYNIPIEAKNNTKHK